MLLSINLEKYNKLRENVALEMVVSKSYASRLLIVVDSPTLHTAMVSLIPRQLLISQCCTQKNRATLKNREWPGDQASYGNDSSPLNYGEAS